MRSQHERYQCQGQAFCHQALVNQPNSATSLKHRSASSLKHQSKPCSQILLLWVAWFQYKVNFIWTLIIWHFIMSAYSSCMQLIHICPIYSRSIYIYYVYQTVDHLWAEYSPGVLQSTMLSRGLFSDSDLGTDDKLWRWRLSFTSRVQQMDPVAKYLSQDSNLNEVFKEPCQVCIRKEGCNCLLKCL